VHYVQKKEGNMTLQNAPRQGKLPGIGKDSIKSVSVAPKRLHNVLIPQNGIPVGKEWKVGADEHNVILYRKRKSKSGKDTWGTFGYYSTLGNALIGLVRQGVRDTELASIQAVQDKIAELEHDILKMAAGR
jgi:hypothetical protein